VVRETGMFAKYPGKATANPSQSTAFLNKMVHEVRSDKISRTELGLLEGYVQREKRQPLKPVFNPVRRKLHIPVE
jgi:hypothetical protein